MGLTSRFAIMQLGMHMRLDRRNRPMLNSALTEAAFRIRRERRYLKLLGGQAVEACRQRLEDVDFSDYAGRIGFAVAEIDRLTDTERHRRIADLYRGEFDELPGGHEFSFKPEDVARCLISQMERSSRRRNSSESSESYTQTV